MVQSIRIGENSMDTEKFRGSRVEMVRMDHIVGPTTYLSPYGEGWIIIIIIIIKVLSKLCWCRLHKFCFSVPIYILSQILGEGWMHMNIFLVCV